MLSLAVCSHTSTVPRGITRPWKGAFVIIITGTKQDTPNLQPLPQKDPDGLNTKDSPEGEVQQEGLWGTKEAPFVELFV